MDDSLIDEFIKVSQRRSELLKQIKDMENDILSISERLEEIKTNNEQLDRRQQTDAFSRARDKRKRVRSEISSIEHEVRMVEAELSTIKMQIRVAANDQ